MDPPRDREWTRSATFERRGEEGNSPPPYAGRPLECFLGRVYQGHKRFSIEGTDMLVPMLDVSVDVAAAHGAKEVNIAMAHRGRINVLAHLLGKPYRANSASPKASMDSTTLRVRRETSNTTSAQRDDERF